MDKKGSFIARGLRTLFLEHRLPYRLQPVNIIYKLTGKRFVFCKNGKRKILKFKTDDYIYHSEKKYFLKFGDMDFKIEENDVVIDVGAHAGFFAVYAANLSKNGNVYCFEPTKQTSERLEFHKRINKLKNMILINKGVSDKEEIVKLYTCNEDAGENSIYNNLGRFEKKNYEFINCISLKQVFDQNGITKCDFLKINCEGAEYKILLSLPEEYFKRIEKVILEYHPGGDVLELAKLFDKHGFKIAIFGYPQKQGMLYAFKE